MTKENLNGAQAIFSNLVANKIDTCFANPGTSEMQLIYEMGLTDDINPILCLQENVVTGACDGYYRMLEKPALGLMHLGVGLANGLSNMHNARQAGSGMVVLVGDNADYHNFKNIEPSMLKHISHLAEPVSDHVHVTKSANDLSLATAQAIKNAQEKDGSISTIVAATNHIWGEVDIETAPVQADPKLKVPQTAIEKTCKILLNAQQAGQKTAIILGKQATIDGLEYAGKIAAKCGAEIYVETISAKLPRGAGRVATTPVPYIAEIAINTMSQYQQIVLVGAKKPLVSIAYKDKSVEKIPEQCTVTTLAMAGTDTVAALADLCSALNANDISEVDRNQRREVPPPAGSLNAQAVGETLNNLLPETAIVVDEGATIGFELFPHTSGARTHDWLMPINGGAIGNGMAVALGAAVACPERKTVVLQADGSGMYNPQALWSIARQQCDMLIVVLKNDSYAILELELARVREGEANDKMMSMMDLDNPSIDWVSMAKGMGVEGCRVSSAEQFYTEFAAALDKKGPYIIQADVEQDLSPLIQMIQSS